MQSWQVSEIAFLLNEMTSDYAHILLSHQWPSENDRWVELLFALVARVANKPEAEVRSVVYRLDALGLVAVDELAAMPRLDADIDLNGSLARRIRGVLCEDMVVQGEKPVLGFTHLEAANCIQVMHEAARALVTHHDGKLQRYLRVYGDKMLDELPQHFSFSKLDAEEVRQAFAYWLQNVLNMPVLLADGAFQTFCREHGTTADGLINEADALDLNIALLDDLIEMRASDRERQHGRRARQSASRTSQDDGRASTPPPTLASHARS